MAEHALDGIQGLVLPAGAAHHGHLRRGVTGPLRRGQPGPPWRAPPPARPPPRPAGPPARPASRARAAATPAATREPTVRPRRNALVEACCSACPRAGWPRAAIWPAAAYAAPTDWCASDTIGPGMCAGVVAVSRVP